MISRIRPSCEARDKVSTTQITCFVQMQREAESNRQVNQRGGGGSREKLIIPNAGCSDRNGSLWNIKDPEFLLCLPRAYTMSFGHVRAKQSSSHGFTLCSKPINPRCLTPPRTNVCETKNWKNKQESKLIHPLFIIFTFHTIIDLSFSRWSRRHDEQQLRVTHRESWANVNQKAIN